MQEIKQKNIELLSKYEPKGVLKYFANLANIPHGSGNEKEIGKYVADTLRPVCKEVVVYDDGTVYAYQNATSGYENKPIVCLQAHSDMVCAKKQDSNHDFLKDPLELKVVDGWLSANNTTLGADDGIGVAYILDVFTNKNVAHGPLECVISTSEETTFHGVHILPAGKLKAKYMINLDHEDSDSFCVGCEGGTNFTLTHKFERKPNPELNEHIQISLKDGVSGHSGNSIRFKIVNANKLMFEFAKMIKNKYPIALIEANGGVLKNAIAGFCTASFAVRSSDVEAIKKLLQENFELIKKEYHEREKKLKLIIEKGSDLDPIQQDISDRLIESYNAMFYGVYSLSEQYPISDGSVNWGVIKTTNDSITVDVLLRALYRNLKSRIQERILSAFHDTKYTYERLDDYPEWTPLVGKNPLQELFTEIYRKKVNKTPVPSVTEGGLETGVIIDKYPHLIALSMGPLIEGVHTPDERTPIEKIKFSYEILREMLINID